MFTEPLRREATHILERCRGKGLMLATAESCTGGLIAALFTEIAGSSAVFERGFVTYSNVSKQALLGVDAALFPQYGAVSGEVAAAMAQGALTRAGVDLAISVTGIAGPDGGTAQKPVGTVYIAVAARDSILVEENHFTGDRSAIRLSSVAKALEMLKASLNRPFVSVA